MNIKETLSEGLKREYDLTLTSKDFENKVTIKFEEITKNMKLPGFRPGKVPLSIIRQRFGDQIRKEAEQEGAMDEDGFDEEDLIPEIMPRHFEEAVRNARRSVSDRDLAQYSSFAVNLQQARGTMTASGGSLGNFAFPASRDGALAATTVDDDEEDLYS